LLRNHCPNSPEYAIDSYKPVIQVNEGFIKYYWDFDRREIFFDYWETHLSKILNIGIGTAIDIVPVFDFNEDKISKYLSKLKERKFKGNKFISENEYNGKFEFVINRYESMFENKTFKDSIYERDHHSFKSIDRNSEEKLLPSGSYFEILETIVLFNKFEESTITLPSVDLKIFYSSIVDESYVREYSLSVTETYGYRLSDTIKPIKKMTDNSLYDSLKNEKKKYINAIYFHPYHKERN